MNGLAAESNLKLWRLILSIIAVALVVSLVVGEACGEAIKCGGVDDTDTIQRALDVNTNVEILGQECVIDAARTVWLPTGRTVDATASTFTIKPGCNFRCRSFETKSDSTDIHWINGTIVGDMTNATGLEWRIGFRINDTRRFRMTGTRIKGWRQDALWIGGNLGAHEITIERVLFEENGRSHVSVVNGSHISFERGTYRNTVVAPGMARSDPGAGINVEGNSGDRVTDLVIQGIEAYANVKGIVVLPGKGLPAMRVEIRNNVLAGNSGYGLIANSIVGGLIYNNRVSGSNLGITIGGATEATRTTGLVIAKNVVEACTNGFRLTGVKDSRVEHNEHPGAIQFPALGVSGDMSMYGNVQR